MEINNRLKQLESATGTRQTMSKTELAKRVERVLECPHLVTPSAYYQIVELIELCKQRQASNDHKPTT